uniref:proteasome assembly chaperone 3-like n=1 Tax=Osmia lignaria TaxID=473952 RepID=UPI0014780F78|nr:proteasome assembly chaperone 3-like [Osmia lignaria]XP_034171947.1 proteasome assembly chaperone 3-like [Osmia lignaria]
MKSHACAIITNCGHHTDIALKIYSNRVLIIATHFKKFGSLITVTKGSSFHQFNNSIFSAKVLFGRDDIEIVAAARYIAEQINLDKPLLISLSLKNYEPDTLRAIANALKELK